MNKHVINSIIFASVITPFSYLVAVIVGWDIEFNWLEALAVWTSYSCTFMCVFQTRWNYPMGIITTFLYSILFYQWEAYAMSAFNLYLVFSLTYGWFRWGPDDSPKPVSFVKLPWWFGYVALGVGIYALIAIAKWYFGAELSQFDVWIAVLSGVAQFLLDNKKLETWGVWFVVNVLSIYYFHTIELHLVAFQYIFFLGNTFWGFYNWRKTWLANRMA